MAHSAKSKTLCVLCASVVKSSFLLVLCAFASSREIFRPVGCGYAAPRLCGEILLSFSWRALRPLRLPLRTCFAGNSPLSFRLGGPALCAMRYALSSSSCASRYSLCAMLLLCGGPNHENGTAAVMDHPLSDTAHNPAPEPGSSVRGHGNQCARVPLRCLDNLVCGAAPRG